MDRLAGILLLLAALFYCPVFGCNGYKVNFTVRFDKTSNMTKDRNFSVQMTDDCKVYTTGCLGAVRDIGAAMASWKVEKGIIQKRGTMDLCAELNKERPSGDEAGSLMQAFSVGKCPMKKNTKACGSKEKFVDMSKMKGQMGMLDGFKGEVDVRHDRGGRSFLKFTVSAKPKAG